MSIGEPRDWGGQKKINFALQGGGSHGAFTWGVLDCILEDGRLDIEAISGTSAGAMNAAVYAQGYLEAGREGARRALESFWRSVSEQSAFLPMRRDALENLSDKWSFARSSSYWWMDFVTHFASPYEFNPLNLNPLREHLVKAVDFEKVRACTDIQIFVAATNVETGRIRVFERPELTAEHIMASACLPFLFQTVEIDGAPYWDGGYMGNPPLFPLFYKTACPDVAIVQINPIERSGTPRTAREIQNRLTEITFNSSLMGEFRAIDFVCKLLDAGKLSPEAYVRPFIHRIEADKELAAYTAASKFDTSWSFLTQLRDIGREAAKRWLAVNYDAIGRKGTLDLRMAFN